MLCLGDKQNFKNKNFVQNIALLDIDHCDETIAKIRADYPTKQILFQLTDVVSRSNQEQAFKAVISKFHSIDCVIACAGVFDELNYERTVSINLVTISSFVHK